MQPEQLLQYIAAGDQAAFRLFYDHYKSKVYNTCLLHLQDEEEAEEITQDVFVEIYHAAGKFLSRSSVNTWVYRITVNKCLDRLRHRKRQKRFAFMTSLFHRDTGDLQHDLPDFVHPEVVMQQRQNATELFKALYQLPDKQQAAFILKHVEGLSQKEISQVMELSEKAVESLLQRAKQGLRKLLDAYYNNNNEGKNKE